MAGNGKSAKNGTFRDLGESAKVPKNSTFRDFGENRISYRYRKSVFFVVFPGSAENVICNFPSFPENLEKNIF